MARCPQAASAAADTPPKRVAAIVSAYFHNSHADVIVSRLLETYTLDGRGESPRMKLASLYTDQVPENDKSRKLAARFNVPIYDRAGDALTLGTGKLAVDGVLLVIEHGKYPTSPTGQVQYPKRRLFEQVLEVFDRSGRVVPVFIDKHLADNWADAKWIYDACRARRIPLMAGSSLPVLWRRPAVDVPPQGELKEIVALSFHTLDGYGFHALEMVQCLAERRRGGETGVRAVRCLEGPAVWEAQRQGAFDEKLLRAALDRLERPPPAEKPLAELVPQPVLWTIEYDDGLKASVLTLNDAVGQWAAAWRDGDDRISSTLFWTQEERPLMHFTYLVQGIDEMVHTGRASWPAERTLLTSGVLDALLISKKESHRLLETPHLKFAYRSDWEWREPPPPLPGRPLGEQ
jgi:hypothetical protein